MLNDQRMVTTLFIPHIDLCMEMITKIIFRPLPSIKKSNINIGMSDTGVDADEVETDPTWPHIRGIYEIFLQLIVNEACDVRTVRTFINPNFISEVKINDSNSLKNNFFYFMIYFFLKLIKQNFDYKKFNNYI